jgi:lipoprotein-releasing system ATP-binding protein
MLEVQGLCKSFPTPFGTLPILTGIDLVVGAGGMLAIMGPSGSGKSTLLSILGGLEDPTSGLVRLDGIDPFSGSSRERAAFRNRHIGFVFQEHHLLDGLTALENVMLPALASGRVGEPMLERAGGLLARVGLADRAHHRPGELSGGERQRVALARALLLRPRLLLADEPTGQLDSLSAGVVVELLIRLAGEEGRLLIVVTHDEAVAARIAAQPTGCIRRLHDGRLAS